ncbi:SAGA transcriptional complex subunit [Mucor ambiguus]|uniref:SAGA transcriptional complex subunit n=1 Tax=Mucor ambiguus TaxID=91626 RepID=A0A0C9LUX7_9FUNG|nr:SAGA transcriptional complex subunit [Mucor ambiguus]
MVDIQKKLPSWLPLSFVLAQHLLEHHVHQQYLTPNEQSYFQDTLVSFATWIAFVNQTDKQDDVDTTAFRVRSMLYEQLIPHIFKTHKFCCKLVSLDPLLEQAHQLCIPPASEVSQAWQTFAEAHASKKDESMTEQDETASTSIVAAEKPNQDTEALVDKAPTYNNEINANNTTTTAITTTSTSNNNNNINTNDASKLEENITAPDNVPLRDIFHSLELDRAAMVEQRKLEEFEAQEELNEAEEAKENAAAKSLSMFNADGNFNLKYLLQGIVANRQKTSLSDRELQNLLSDFKGHRSKWANDDRVGQEELYEACEKVLIDLKNYTEHSTPFLNKVNKREAPDYFDVIKKPMDLGTVTKKMKNLNYRSKKEFADDLYLIYDNCLAYNTNPASEYRKHAIAMRRKTERLMARVPNISIKEIKQDVDDEGDEMSEEEEHEPQHRVSRKSAGKHMPIERKSTPIQQIDRHSRERSLTRGSSVAPLSALEISDTENAFTPEMASTPQYGGKHVKSNQTGEGADENIDLEQEEKKLNAEIDADLGEYQDQVWRDKTKKTRAKLTTDIEKQYQFSFSEREALTRSGLDMERFAMIEHLHDKPEAVVKLVRCEFERFLKWTDRRSTTATLYDDFDLDSSDDENLDAFFSRRITKPNKTVDDSTRNDLFLPDYEIASGIPEIDGVPEDVIEPTEPSNGKAIVRKSSIDLSPEALLAAQGFSNVSLDVYPQLQFPTYGLTPLIDKSNKALEQVRLMYAKCNAIRNNVPISTLASSIEELDEAIADDQKQLVPMPSSSAKIPPFALNTESGHQMAQKVLSKLLAHAGFEGAKIGALNVLTDVMTDYLTNIGKTLRSYWDDYGHDMDGDEMLCHTLYENGILDISDLENYVHDDVEKNINRLDDVKRRLQASYQDMIAGPSDKPVQDDDTLLNEEDTFITGVFGEDLGEDYFGFKSIGLDREYSLDALNIPSRLWFGKKDKSPTMHDANKEPQYKYPPPPSFLPLTSEKNVIGLLQPFFAKKLSDPSGKPLIEDEYIPKSKNRPRYPPTNKTAAGRKKLAKEASSSQADHRKNKRKRPTEEIVAEKAEKAEKKRQKMEEKAQRIAEKEQKRKLREELREQEKQAKIEAKEKKKLMNKKSKQTKAASSSIATDSPAENEDDE